ncbi:amino acid ABC transporter permease [Streptosporangium roseum]|uniref:ABC-type amino acid transport system permease component-like protein n=1 Tax=Streptosporangium roseum (strain ATCC 12428 / DSM 43021 / JCM 3005 / KCTC 9067 / NCIMB 10171 / NRRL 2505 / NI 9100) TaxID=479432 RepID=D2AY31_STRRD|nr:amino acid ABC transporter permease [Streptosporangium roseum]ACZ85202.1 ABC-type amino acid transport system permease component-like protein [Streptosporangium roseum DSM 43021]
MSTLTAEPRKTRKRATAPDRVSVLYDAPGPRARVRNTVLTVVVVLVALLAVYVMVTKLDEKNQLNADLWTPFLRGDVWINLILPGLFNTLSAAAVAALIAVPFGFVFGIGRLSDHAWIRVPAGAVVEFFRAIPLLIMIFAVMYGGSAVFGLTVTPFMAVVTGLVLYNGSVLAEIVRAGILSIPRGQSEAALAIGLRKGQVMRMILLPQGVTAMMPAIVAQLVVLLKDTALGFIVSFEDLLNAGARVLPSNFNNIIPAVIVIAIIYIIINLIVGAIATWLEMRSRRSRKTSAQPVVPPGAVVAPGSGDISAVD